MHSNSQSNAHHCTMIPLCNYDSLRERYQSLKLSERAKAVLTDAEPALKLSEETLRTLSGNPLIKEIFAKIRKNSIIAGKMRPSEARDLMLDSSSDFIESSLHKLAAWRKTMERICSGEGISTTNEKEFISSKNPLAMAIAGTSGLSNYLSIVQVALMELIRADKKNANDYRTTISELRRCATILGDYENAAGIGALVY